jgi:hypothetical protein
MISICIIVANVWDIQADGDALRPGLGQAHACSRHELELR